MANVDSHDGHKRAIADYVESSQFARTAAQFTFGANGGAAAAVLSFVTTTVNSAVKTEFDRRLIVHNFSIGCSFYVAGLLVAAISMYLFAKSKKRWGDAWEDAAFTGNYSFGSFFAVRAQKLETIAWLTLVVSAVMFAVGSFFSLFGFLKQ
jgi:multidrug efflux pump subunit AcrB